MKLQSSNKKEFETSLNTIKEKRKAAANYTYLCWDASGIHSISLMHSLEVNKQKKPSQNYHFASRHLHGSMVIYNLHCLRLVKTMITEWLWAAHSAWAHPPDVAHSDILVAAEFTKQYPNANAAIVIGCTIQCTLSANSVQIHCSTYQIMCTKDKKCLPFLQGQTATPHYFILCARFATWWLIPLAW